VAAGRALPARPGLAAVGALVAGGVGAVDGVGVGRVDLDLGEVVPPAIETPIGAEQVPCLAAVVGPVDACPYARLYRRVNDAVFGGGDPDAAPSQASVVARRRLHQRLPAAAAVGGLVEAALRPRPVAVLPRPLPACPEVAVDGVGVLGIEYHLCRSGVGVRAEDLLPVLAAVARLVEPPRLVRPVRVAEDGHV